MSLLIAHLQQTSLIKPGILSTALFSSQHPYLCSHSHGSELVYAHMCVHTHVCTTHIHTHLSLCSCSLSIHLRVPTQTLFCLVFLNGYQVSIMEKKSKCVSQGPLDVAYTHDTGSLFKASHFKTTCAFTP